MKMYRLTVAADVRCYHTVRFEAETRFDATRQALNIAAEMEPGTEAPKLMHPEGILGNRAIVDLTGLDGDEIADQLISFMEIDEDDDSEDRNAKDRFRRALFAIKKVAQNGMGTSIDSLEQVVVLANTALMKGGPGPDEPRCDRAEHA